MPTYTTNLSLIKPAEGEQALISQINSNMDTLDTKASTVDAAIANINSGGSVDGKGVFVCTSTTRPTDPYPGMVIFETDSGLVSVYNSGSGWLAVKGFVQSHSFSGLALTATYQERLWTSSSANQLTAAAKAQLGLQSAVVTAGLIKATLDATVEFSTGSLCSIDAIIQCTKNNGSAWFSFSDLGAIGSDGVIKDVLPNTSGGGGFKRTYSTSIIIDASTLTSGTKLGFRVRFSSGSPFSGTVAINSCKLTLERVR